MTADSTNAPPVPEFVAPAWIEVNLIQKALQNGDEKNKEVVDISVCSATAPGDNYASTIYRVKATLSDGEEKSFVVKGPAPGALTADFVANMNSFQKEGFMLTEVIPNMQALLEEAAPGRFPPFAARCPLHGASPVDHLVLEDLAPEGFRLADRKRGLGLRHALLALRTLARFHAASRALLQRQPEVAQRLGNPWLDVREEMQEYTVQAVEAVADAFRGWGGYEDCARLLDQFKNVAYKTSIDVLTPKLGNFNVIGHGDFWVNNMMFRYEDGHPSGVRFVDLQIAAIVSPAIDLLYFLNSSVSEDVSLRHYDLLLREYHFALRETAELLGIQAPSLEALLEEIDAHGPHAMITLLHLMPVVKADKAPDFDEALVDVASMNYLYQHPTVSKWFKRAVPEFARKGWIPVPA